jgi:hypothetical protein
VTNEAGDPRPDATMVLNPVFPDGFTSGLGWMIFQRNAAGQVASSRRARSSVMFSVLSISSFR